MLEQKHYLFIGTVLGSIFCLFLPFIEGKTGYGALFEVGKTFVDRIGNMDLKQYFIFSLFLGTYLWLPIMIYAYYRYAQKKRTYNLKQRSINYFLFTVGSSVYILPTYAFFDGVRLMETFKLGYWGLMIMMGGMFYSYLKLQKEQLIIDDDYKHLVD